MQSAHLLSCLAEATEAEQQRVVAVEQLAAAEVRCQHAMHELHSAMGNAPRTATAGATVAAPIPQPVPHQLSVEPAAAQVTVKQEKDDDCEMFDAPLVAAQRPAPARRVVQPQSHQPSLDRSLMESKEQSMEERKEPSQPISKPPSAAAAAASGNADPYATSKVRQIERV